MRSLKKGFTLIELLVVIAIIAILAVVVILTLNPAELLRQSRDANRLSDLATINSAINIYNTDQSAATSYSLGTGSTTYISVPDPSATSTAGDQCQGLGVPGLPSGYAYNCPASATFRNINTTGWIPINFSLITSGSPIGNLPVDPINQTSSNYYSYQTNGSLYEVNAMLESQKYVKTPLMDGGNDPALYEIGTGAASLPDAGRALAGYWNLDDGAGTTAKDISGAANNGTLVSSPTWTAAGKINGAIQFNGSNYISTALTWPNSGSIALWVYPTAYNAWESPAGWKFAPASGGYILIDEGGAGSPGAWRFVFNPAGTSEQDIYGAGVTQNQWTHLVATWSGAGNTYTITFYINGVSQGSNTYSGSPSGSIGPFYIGTAGQSANNDYTGNADDVRVYDQALTATQVLQLYNAEK